jgi:hypothetical protein
VALLAPELDDGAVAEDPVEVEPELLVEPELPVEPELVPEPEPVAADPPEVAAAPEEALWADELPPVLAVECVAPGSSNATTPPAVTPARPIATVMARSRDLARSRSATARATSRCRLVIAGTSHSSLRMRLPAAAPPSLWASYAPAMSRPAWAAGR